MSSDQDFISASQEEVGPFVLHTRAPHVHTRAVGATARHTIPTTAIPISDVGSHVCVYVVARVAPGVPCAGV